MRNTRKGSAFIPLPKTEAKNGSASRLAPAVALGNADALPRLEG
jgi:hypothetical protein